MRKTKRTAKTGQKTIKGGQNNQTAQLLKPPKRRRKRRDTEALYLDPEEMAALFKAITNKRDTAIFRIAYQRGLRASEVGMLQMEDFNERRGTLFVHRKKGSEDRTYRLLPPEMIALRAWMKVRGPDPGPLFPSQMGPRAGKLGIHRNRLDQLIKQYCQKAGIRAEKAHMHVLKHSCGTHLAERGESAHVIQDWLGHVNSQSTDVYLHFTSKMRDEAYERLKGWK
jgi:integrase